MRIATFTLYAALFLGTFCSAATAAENRVELPANRESMIGYISGVAENCHNAAKPKLKLTRPPEHGSVRFQ